MIRFIFLFLVVGMLWACGGGDDTGDITSSCGSEIENEAFLLVNAERQKESLPALVCNETAIKAARQYSQYMCDAEFFSHTGPDGSTPQTRIIAAGVDASTLAAVGENIAAGYMTAEAVVVGWMNSPGHRANILHTGFKETGIGYYDCPSSQYRNFWTQVFLTTW